MAKKEEGGQSAGGGEVRLPSADELSALPRWAKVAFAARCARRVQPLFLWAWPPAPIEHVNAIEKAITRSEESAAGAVESDADYAGADVAAAAATAHADYADYVEFAAASAAAAAAYAYSAYPEHAAANAIAAANADARWREKTVRAMRRDYELLRGASEAEMWTDETPVPLEFFGPLWPEGEPEGWPGTAPKAGIPSEDELSQIPRWARVAFASRCARRIAPLASEIRATEHHAAMHRAIESAEAAAANARQIEDHALKQAMRRAANTVDSRPSIDAVDTASCALLEAMADSASSPGYPNYAHSAGQSARFAFQHGDVAWIEPGVGAMRRDFELLKAANESEKWTHETPVPPQFFGPLWLWGEPEAWPETEERVGNARITLKVRTTKELPESYVIERIAKRIALLDRLHRAYGGKGINSDGMSVYPSSHGPKALPDTGQDATESEQRLNHSLVGCDS